MMKDTLEVNLAEAEDSPAEGRDGLHGPEPDGLRRFLDSRLDGAAARSVRAARRRIEFFTDGANANVFAEPLADESRLVDPTVSVCEVFRVVLRRRGEDDALRVAAPMGRGREIPLSSALALEAARLTHASDLAMADGIILATARLAGATLWTQDADFAGMPHVRYVPKATR